MTTLAEIKQQIIEEIARMANQNWEMYQTSLPKTE